MLVATLAAALLFAAVHLLIGRMAGLHGTRRSGWLSFSGGIAVAYVFLHVLPDLIEHNEVLVQATGVGEWLADRIVYLVALIGLAVFYGLELQVRASRRSRRGQGEADRPHDVVFAVHIGAFAVYNLLIGYLLLHREVAGYWSLALYAAALGLHFLSSDYGLYLHHRERYQGYGRWVMAGAVLGGWLLGLLLDLPEAAISLIFAFLAGSIVLNVIKEELPEERGSRLMPFAAGLAVYAVVILAL